MARNINLSEAIREYTASLKAQDLAENTIKNRTQPLYRGLKEWGDIYVSSIKAVHIDRLFRAGDWAASTRNLYLSDVRQFLAWSRNHGYMGKDFDPTFGWRNSRVPEQDKLRIPVERFYELLDACEHPRDRAICALGLFAFPRGSELQAMRVNDLDLSAATLDIYRIKTKQYDTLPVSEELREEMVRWLNWLRADQGQLVGNWYLTPSKKPHEWTWRGKELVLVNDRPPVRPTLPVGHPYDAVQRAISNMGYGKKGEGLHTLRRSGARAYFDSLREQGVDSALLRVASFLGHRDVRVTQEYIGLKTEREQRNKSIAGQRMFPKLQQVSDTGKLRVIQGGQDHG